MTANRENMRESFETWHAKEYISTEPLEWDGDGYSDFDHNRAWKAYQAGIAALAASPAPRYETQGYKLAMRVLQSDLYAQLDDAERAECDALVRTGMAAPQLEAAQPAPMPDQAGFEAWAKNHGEIDLTPAGDAYCENFWFPATYYKASTETAWRAWANKPAAQQEQAPQPMTDGLPPLPGPTDFYDWLKTQTGIKREDRWYSAEQMRGYALLSRHPAQPVSAPVALTDEFIDRLIQRICELPDRNSPEDDPEAMVCSPEELRDAIRVTEEEFGELGRDVYVAPVSQDIASLQEQGNGCTDPECACNLREM